MLKRKLLEEQLEQGLEELPLPALSIHQRRQLISYLELLAKWNKSYNLTAITEPTKMVTHHLLDSLAIAAYIKGQRVIDVGAGAGLPGIPLAIAMSNTQFVLLDSNGKKCRFMTQAKGIFGLNNIEVITNRVEDFMPDGCFDTVVTRAFASLGEMLKKCAHLCCDDGQFIAMKGRHPQAEIEEISEQTQQVTVHQLDVPLLQEDRHLVVVKN